jgi:hypothetical protein
MFNPELESLAEPSERLESASSGAYAVLQSGARQALGDAASEADVAAAAFLGWSVAHGAACLWVDGPLRKYDPKQGAKARFLAQADQAIGATVQALKAL